MHDGRWRPAAYAVAVFLAAAAAGCGIFVCNQAAADITGLRNDLIAVFLEQSPSACDCSSCSVPCVPEETVDLDPSGGGTALQLLGNANYAFISISTGNGAFPTTPCSGSISVTIDPPANPDPQGQITISGGGVTCTKIYYNGQFFSICNSGTISLTLDGYTVSTSPATTSSTASSVAADLAAKIDSDSNLGPLLGAASSGATVYVIAKQAAIEYPWQTSCAYDPQYFRTCAFSASLSPGAAIVPK
jgi:hypothetical protein